MFSKDTESRRPNVAALYAIGFAMLAGLVVIILSATTPLSVTTGPSVTKFLANASIGVLIAGAFALVGSLLGFLFGIPRTLQSENPPAKPGETQDGRPVQPNNQNVSYGANTNLEQISDWLTKILVGVGLTQLTVLPEKLKDLATFMAPGFDVGSQSNVLAMGILLYFAVCGFLFTR